MHSMAIDRRTVLGLLAGGLAWPLLPLPLRGEVAHCLYLSARADAGGGFRVGAFDAAGRARFDLPLPDRGHSLAVQPSGGVAVQFARRPGTFARVIDLRRGAFVQEITAPAARHFYGHGVFSPDGRLLYATENDFAAGRGVIGIYDAADSFRRLGELPSHGIGPHDLRLLADGETLVVANGGILTRPDLPRVKLNVPTMAPSLVYLHRRDGRLLEEVRLAPELHQLGIRHLAVGRGGMVAIAMQYEGPAGDRVPLIATHRRSRSMELFEAPPEVLRAMRHYCGSAAFDASGRVLAVSSPRGGIVTFWDARHGRYLSSASVPDGCGVAPAARAGHFLVSSGQGGMVEAEATSGRARMVATGFAAGRWDNHLVVAGIA